jgi:hypothetical protein
LLGGKTVNAQLAAQVAAIVAEDIQPVSDLRGSSEFRRAMVGVVTAARWPCCLESISMKELPHEHASHRMPGQRRIAQCRKSHHGDCYRISCETTCI